MLLCSHCSREQRSRGEIYLTSRARDTLSDLKAMLLGAEMVPGQM